MIHVEKTAVRLSIIAFISVNFLNRLLCMATGGNAVGKIDAVTNRGRGEFRGENKTIINIYRGMLLQSIMGLVVLDYPVRLQITRELEGIPVLIQLAFRGVSLFSLLLDIFIADGVTGGLNQTGINGNSLMLKPFWENC